MKFYLYLLIIIFVQLSCNKKEKSAKHIINLTPIVKDNGVKIIFPNTKSIRFFETDTVNTVAMNAEIKAPAKVSATVLKNGDDYGKLVLFEDEQLAANYTLFMQHLININQILNVNIKQKRIELSRIRDLQQHGAATGKDLLEAETALAVEETNLQNEKAANIEHETHLIASGFQPEKIKTAQPGQAYIICDIPESQLNNIKTGNECKLIFPSFPNQSYKGRIEAITDLIDQSTRMVKLRVNLDNPNGKLKAGMFATVSFGVSEGKNISIDRNSIITIQGKDYVFLKTDSVTFIRKEIKSGDQIGDRIIVYDGIKNEDEIASKGVMQLKGLSFGY